MLGKPSLVGKPVAGTKAAIRCYKGSGGGVARYVLEVVPEGETGGGAPETVNSVTYQFPEGRYTPQQALALAGLGTAGVALSGSGDAILLNGVAGGYQAVWVTAEGSLKMPDRYRHRDTDAIWLTRTTAGDQASAATPAGIAATIGRPQAVVEAVLGSPAGSGGRNGNGSATYNFPGFKFVEVAYSGYQMYSVSMNTGGDTSWEAALRKAGFATTGVRLDGGQLLGVQGLPKGFRVFWGKGFYFGPNENDFALMITSKG